MEKKPYLQILFYNKLLFFKFSFRQYKDYLGLKLLLDKKEKVTFVDIGDNKSLFITSFREMGFEKNQILVFKPDIFLIPKSFEIK